MSTSILFTRIGLHVGHEIDDAHVLKYHGVTTEYDGCVTGVFKNMTFDPSRYDVILHMTRHPLWTIASTVKIGGRLTLDILQRFVKDERPPQSGIERAMRSWVVFNRMAEDLAAYTFQAERMKYEFPKICNEYLGLKVKKMPRAVERYNKSRHDSLSWWDLRAVNHALADEIQAMAIRYGYEESTP
jgi:hypothetical protein